MSVMDAWMMFNKDNDTFVTIDEMKKGVKAALPQFDFVWNATVMRSPTTVAMVEAANRTSMATRRRRLESELLSGQFRRRMLSVRDPKTGKQVRRLTDGGGGGAPGTDFNVSYALDYSLKTQAMINSEFTSTIPNTEVAQAFCSSDASKCKTAENAVEAADVNKDGMIDTEEWEEKLPEKMSSDPEVKAEQDAPPEPKAGPSVCSKLKEALPVGVSITCNNEKDLEKMKGENVAEKMDACDMADRSSGELADGKMDNAECKAVFDPSTPYDEMLAICAGGDPATMQKCREEGVGTSHCVS
ncbi:unnamed protein product [Amoebophrya sp. A25]|nr:unnamed protein product [Amoebophrya sp. A25]|eukprot:GSA25T00027440001.1